MKNYIYMLILTCGLLVAACGNKDESSTTGTKTASGPATSGDSRDNQGQSPILEDTRGTRWNLYVHDANDATLVSPNENQEQGVVRVDIKKAGTQTSWHIQLNKAPLKVEAQHRYRLNFRARAEATRNVFLGFARAHEPWTDLGLYRSLVLNPEWHNFQEEFVAGANDDNARIVFDLGGNPISTEIADVKLYPVGDGQ